MRPKSRNEAGRPTPRTRRRSSSDSEQSSLTSRLLQAQDEERRRISRELHDSVGQSLCALKMTLDSLRRAIPNDETLGGRLEDCIRTVELSLTQVRTVSYLLHPPTLDLTGLASAIRWYAEGFAERSGIQVDVRLPEKLPRLSSASETALFRVVQESLTNVHRYSGASTGLVQVQLTGDEVTVVVQDNGRGMDPSRLAAVMKGRGVLGVGIAGMQERLLQLGGRLEVHSSNQGTRVTAHLPLPADLVNEPEPDLPIATISSPSRAGTQARILIIDDHELMRQGLRTLLEREQDFMVCGEAANAAEGIGKIRQFSPDVIILDLSMPDGHGWSVVREVRKQALPTKIVIFTAYDYPDVVAGTLACDGYVLKSQASTDVVQAIRTVLQGGRFILGKADAAGVGA